MARTASGLAVLGVGILFTPLRNACAPVSLDELRVWFSGVGEPCGRVKWPWWVNQTGDRQVERELAAYKRERAN